MVITAAIVLLALDVVADPERFGNGVGQLSVFIYVLGIGASHLRQRGRRKLVAVAGAVFTVVLIVCTVILYQKRKTAELPVLTEADRAPLVVKGTGAERRLVHPALGFSMPHPGPKFQVMNESNSYVTESIVRHSYIDQTTSSGVIFTLTVLMSVTEKNLKAMLSSLEQGIVEPLKRNAGGKFTFERKQLTFSADNPRVKSHILLSGRLDFRTRAWSISKGSDRTYVLFVTVVGMDQKKAPALLAGVRLND
jgi:hypothetical protein